MTRPGATSGAGSRLRDLEARIWTPAGASQPPTMRRPAVYGLAAATVLVLGANWPIMSTGVGLIPALWLAAFRMAGAALVVAAVLAVQGRVRVPAREDRAIWLSIGLARLATVTALVFLALRFVPPGRSSILAYTGALWTAPLATVFLHEPLTRSRLAGLALGTLGLVVLLEPWSLDWGDTGLLVGTGMLLLAATGNASTTVHIRGHRWVGSPIELMPWQLGLAAIPITTLALLADGLPRIEWTGGAVAIVLYQVFLGSAFGLWGLITVGRSLPALSVNLLVMAVPVVGLATSVVFVEEPLTVAVVLGLVLVLGGVAVGLRADRRRPEDLAPLT